MDRRRSQSSEFVRVCWPMWTRERPPCPRGFCTSAARCAGWAGWTTGTPFWTPTPRSGSGGSPFSPSRRSSPMGIPLSRCWTRRGIWISPPRWSERWGCWTALCWSSAARTVSRATPAPCGGCWPGTVSRPSCSSTRWTWRAVTGTLCLPRCGPGSTAAVWTLQPDWSRSRRIWPPAMRN